MFAAFLSGVRQVGQLDGLVCEFPGHILTGSTQYAGPDSDEVFSVAARIMDARGVVYVARFVKLDERRFAFHVTRAE